MDSENAPPSAEFGGGAVDSEDSTSLNDDHFPQPNFDDSSSQSSTMEQPKALEMKIIKWNAVAAWKWMANDDSCGICRMAFDACCSDCKTPGDDCPLVWGRCSHPFHIHCIMKWLEANSAGPHCPLCRQPWHFSQHEPTNNSSTSATTAPGAISSFTTATITTASNLLGPTGSQMHEDNDEPSP